MTSDTFNEIIEKQMTHSLNLLTRKGLEYAPSDDRLSAFKAAAGLQGCTSAQAAFGMLAKHLVSLADMTKASALYTPAVWDEKIGDSINYLLILRAIADEEGRDYVNAEYTGTRLES
jgi:hypothetical protein